jgi:hypothetical protein
VSHDHGSGFDWPFDEATNVAVITTRHVLAGDLPILLVTHDDDGDWQVLCGTTSDPADGRVACLGCLFVRDPAIGELADLPLGWRAWRENASAPWLRAARTDDE